MGAVDIGTAILIGVTVGGLTSQLFVPCYRWYMAQRNRCPLQVASGQDYIKIYTVVAIMLSGAIGFLGMFISRIKIHQAIKLGED